MHCSFLLILFLMLDHTKVIYSYQGKEDLLNLSAILFVFQEPPRNMFSQESILTVVHLTSICFSTKKVLFIDLAIRLSESIFPIFWFLWVSYILTKKGMKRYMEVLDMGKIESTYSILSITLNPVTKLGQMHREDK